MSLLISHTNVVAYEEQREKFVQINQRRPLPIFVYPLHILIPEPLWPSRFRAKYSSALSHCSYLYIWLPAMAALENKLKLKTIGTK